MHALSDWSYWQFGTYIAHIGIGPIHTRVTKYSFQLHVSFQLRLAYFDRSMTFPWWASTIEGGKRPNLRMNWMNAGIYHGYLCMLCAHGFNGFWLLHVLLWWYDEYDGMPATNSPMTKFEWLKIMWPTHRLWSLLTSRIVWGFWWILFWDVLSHSLMNMPMKACGWQEFGPSISTNRSPT